MTASHPPPQLRLDPPARRSAAAMSQISHRTEADGAIHIVTLNRPDAQNALTMDLGEWDDVCGTLDWLIRFFFVAYI